MQGILTPDPHPHTSGPNRTERDRTSTCPLLPTWKPMGKRSPRNPLAPPITGRDPHCSSIRWQNVTGWAKQRIKHHSIDPSWPTEPHNEPHPPMPPTYGETRLRSTRRATLMSVTRQLEGGPARIEQTAPLENTLSYLLQSRAYHKVPLVN